MSARLVEIIVPDFAVTAVRPLIARHCRRYWQEPVPGDLEKFSCLVQHRYVERLLTELDERFGEVDGFCVVVVKLEAALPPIVESAATHLPASDAVRPQTRLEAFFSRDRVSTDELYDDVEESVTIAPSYLLTVSLATIIAALGMRSGQTAVVIGAMVIAPLLGPTMGMALAATVGDRHLGGRSAFTLGIGVLLALAVATLLGLMIDIDPQVAELRNRTIVQPADIALALASGAAGVLALGRGATLALVGVMIAVALVPPLAAAGLFFGHGYGVLGFNALFLFTVNLVCINVAGIGMFLLQGLPPKSWRMTGGILAFWATILSVLAALLVSRVAFGVASVQLFERIISSVGGG